MTKILERYKGMPNAKETCEGVAKIAHYFCSRKCIKCKGHNDAYMVKDKLWRKTVGRSGYVCMACFERLLGRKLRPSDFNDSPMNEYMGHWKPKAAKTKK